MQAKRPLVRLACPSCRKTGRIKINPSYIRLMARENGGGVMAMHVHTGEVCAHEFTVHVDAHGKARSAYK